MKKIFICFITFLFLVCGKNTTDPPTWEGDINSSGFPEVTGIYAFTTRTIKGSCSDGSSGTYPATSFNVAILQSNGNEIMGYDTDTTSSLPAGYTVISATGLKGTVQKADGATAHFIMTSTVVFNVVSNDYVGRLTITDNISGDFTNDSWSGDYSYTTYITGGSCTYSTTFKGDKVTSNHAKTVFDKVFPFIHNNNL
jgi:hypothetical protein